MTSSTTSLPQVDNTPTSLQDVRNARILKFSDNSPENIVTASAVLTPNTNPIDIQPDIGTPVVNLPTDNTTILTPPNTPPMDNINPVNVSLPNSVEPSVVNTPIISRVNTPVQTDVVTPITNRVNTSIQTDVPNTVSSNTQPIVDTPVNSPPFVDS